MINSHNSLFPLSEEAQPVVEPVTDTQTQTERPWLVVVLNDPVNLMNYVVMVFRRVFGYDVEKATRHMLEVHQRGRSVLWIGERESAEHYVQQLQQWQLNAKLEADS